MKLLLALTISLAGWQIALIVSVAVVAISASMERPPQGFLDFTGFRTMVLTLVLVAAWFGYGIARIAG